MASLLDNPTQPDWEALKAVPAWTPLAALPFTAERIDDILYRLAPTVYVLAPDYDESLEVRPGGPFVASLLWAPNDGAALRSVNAKIEADTQQDVVLPPRALLLPVRPTYQAMLDEVRTGRHGPYLEHARYRIATDGAFIQRLLSVGPLDFRFRHRSGGGETPYAIEYRLKTG